MTAGVEWHLRADAQVGEGTYGRVYKATRMASGQVIALKKSRASLSLKSTLLNHERLLLQRLQGHPTIPQVFAYGRLPHFEYLALEFLGMALDDISALEHIHENGVIHCDMKPGNILLHPTNPRRLYLVDYGFAGAIGPMPQSTSPNTSTYHVVGTLPYASLNMHYGIHPAPRDDVESFGYSLLNLVRGDLPWTYNTLHGTRKTQYDQVRIKKKQYRGPDLAPDGFAWIGQMIDHARGLKFDQLPKYNLLRSLIRECDERANELDSPDIDIDWNVSAEVPSDDPSPRTVPNDPTFPLSPGQIICCQADVRTTLEGCSARLGDPSFWNDPSLSPEKWDTAVRPAVILSIEMDRWSMLWSMRVVCIGRGTLQYTDANVVPISTSPAAGCVTPTPVWPLSGSYCYIFPRPMKFLCYPGDVPLIPSPWVLSTTDLDLLKRRLDNDTFAQTLSSSQGHYINEDLFVKVTALGPDLEHTNDNCFPGEWGGQRAWFDEHADLVQRRREHERCGVEHASGDAPSDSYWEWDFERWGHCQGNLTPSLTLDSDDGVQLPPLPSRWRMMCGIK